MRQLKEDADVALEKCETLEAEKKELLSENDRVRYLEIVLVFISMLPLLVDLIV